MKVVFDPQSLLTLYLSLSTQLVYAGERIEYWAANYDTEANCKSEATILELKRTVPNQCVTSVNDDPQEAIEDCKQSLSQSFMSTCRNKYQESIKVGKLLYCNKRGVTTCCFHDHHCDTWETINSRFTEVAVQYMKDKTAYLDIHVEKYRENTCHPIKGYDATECAKDCDTLLKTSPLRETCQNKGGLLKCCTMRDVENCDECRYCCTLVFCSYEDRGGIHSISENFLRNYTEGDQEIGLDAAHEMRAYASMYKGRDMRCLKVDYTRDPEDWDHYDPDSYYEALTQDALQQAKTIKFDKRFFNFENKQVFKELTNPKGNMEIWRDVYGFDFSLPVDLSASADSPIFNGVGCSKECMYVERYSKFAKNCRKHDGLFKCCMTHLSLFVYDDTRRALEKMGYISKSSSEDRDKSKRYHCSLTYSCTRMNPWTGHVNVTYSTPEVNPLGGSIYRPAGLTRATRAAMRVGFRNSFCDAQDYCLTNWGALLPIETFGAVTKQDFCMMQLAAIDKQARNETQFARETLQECLKRKSAVRICPNKYLEKINNKQLNDMNDELDNFRKNLKEYRKERKKNGWDRTKVKKYSKKLKKTKRKSKEDSKSRSRSKEGSRSKRRRSKKGRKRRSKKRRSKKSKRASGEAIVPVQHGIQAGQILHGPEIVSLGHEAVRATKQASQTMMKTTEAIKEDNFKTTELDLVSKSKAESLQPNTPGSEPKPTVENQATDTLPEPDTKTLNADLLSEKDIKTPNSLPEPQADSLQPEKEHGIDYGEQEQGEIVNTRIGMILAHQRSIMKPLMRVFKSSTLPDGILGGQFTHAGEVPGLAHP